jgi:hypothetical protein|tara:strand:+ start:4791 stop:7490 length:2700 start_codon:yes stop_codon:yes gene_type:complete
MSFTLSISSDNITFSEVDLFEEQELFYEASFYDDVDVSKIKIPFFTTLNIPLTNTNKSVLSYNPISQNTSNYPLSDYYFKINVHNSNYTTINGIMTVSSYEFNSYSPFIEVELKDFITVFMSDLSSLGLGDVLTSSYYSTQHSFNDFLLTTSNGGEAGTVNTDPDYTRPVNFPYVDLANDTLKYTYEARHFVEYGSGMDRTAFMPTLSVKNYLNAIGDYLSNSSREVEVRSKLFGINDTVYDTDFQPEKLQVLVPAKLQAVKEVNTRQFELTQAPERMRPNENLDIGTNIDGSSKLMRTIAFGDGEAFGNYGTTGTSYQKYGIKNQSTRSYPLYDSVNESYENELGYFCPHMSFKGRVQFVNGDAFKSTGAIGYDIPLIDEDKMVKKINGTSSNMKFGLFLCIYEDKYIKKEIRLNDSNGVGIELDIANATFSRGVTQKLQGEFNGSDFLNPAGGSTLMRMNTLDPSYPNGGLVDKINFSSVDAYLPTDDSIEFDVAGESRYGVSIVLKPIFGEINIEYVSQFDTVVYPVGSGYNVIYANAWNTDNFEVEDIRKAKTDLANYDDLDLLIKAHEDYNIYFMNDEFVIKDSLNETTDLGPVDILKSIAKRFGCGLFYEFESNTHILRIDPIHMLRDNTLDGDSYIDDSVSIKVFRPTDIIKNLIVSNEGKGLFYDKYKDYDEEAAGTINQVLNSNGINDFKIELKSSVYRNSLCGDIFFETNSNIDLGIISPSEAGITDNVFTRYFDTGIRYAYLIEPLYKTNLKAPFSIETNRRPNLQTTTQRIYINMYNYDTGVDLNKHTFNGRLTNKNSSGFDLLGEDKDKNTSDYYDLISATEQITSKGKASVEVSMVLPVSSMSTVGFMLDKYTLSLINNQKLLIKSAEGQVYNDNAYLNVKGLIE